MAKQYSKEEIDDLLSRHPIPSDNKKAIEDLLNLFPEFRNSEFNLWADDPIPHMVFSDFCRFIKDHIKNNPNVESDALMKKIADFISDLFALGSKDLKDLVLTGVFEELAEDQNTKSLVSLLSIDAGKVFNEYFLI